MLLGKDPFSAISRDVKAVHFDNRFGDDKPSTPLIHKIYICYHHNKEDIDGAPQYIATCLLQLSLNWISPATARSRAFFFSRPLSTSVLASGIYPRKASFSAFLPVWASPLHAGIDPLDLVRIIGESLDFPSKSLIYLHVFPFENRLNTYRTVCREIVPRPLAHGAHAGCGQSVSGRFSGCPGGQNAWRILARKNPRSDE